MNSSPVEKDEIVNSLKRFGVKSTYINENQACPSLQEIMQDFALNGLVFIEVKKNTSAIRRSVMLNSFNDYIFGKMKIKHSFNKIHKIGKYSNYKSCVFCENNNEPEAVYKSHSVRDSLGKVLCPKLRTYICPICGASGDTAHTVKYCPCKPIITMEDTINYEHTRVTRTAFVKQEVKY